MVGSRNSPLAQLMHSRYRQQCGRHEAEEEEVETGWGVKKFGQLATAVEVEENELNERKEVDYYE